jgi:glycosyltransferase involved in cell wall biosynthesis
MKICFYRHSLLNRGGDKMVVEYANYLCAEGHHVTILTSCVDSVFKANAKIVQISHRKHIINTLVTALFKKFDFDIIIADIIILSLALALRNKKAIVYFAQDYDESYYRNSVLRLLIRTAYYINLNLLKVPVIAVSESLGQLLRTRFSARVDVVLNGVDKTVFYPERDQSLLSLKGKKKVVLIFARSDYRKGFDLALRTLSKFTDKIENGSLAIWVIGDQVNESLEVHNFGKVTPQSLRKILSSVDVLLYPSRHEGLPLLILEALSCGCPIVTTEAVTILTSNYDGLVCDIGDVECLAKSLSVVLYDNERRNKFITHGFLTADRYSLEEGKRHFLQVLQNVRVLP